MPISYIDSKNKIRFIPDDIFRSNADAIVISQSTEGTVSNSFLSFVTKTGIQLRKNTELGNVDLLAIGDYSNAEYPYQYAMMATSVIRHTSSYSVIRQLAINLSEQIVSYPSIKRVALPVLGSGAGNLDPIDCLKIIVKTLVEYGGDHQFDIYIYDSQLYGKIETMDSTIFVDKTSSRFVLEAIAKYTYSTTVFQHIINSESFYHELALQKFREYEQFQASSDSFFNDLFADFNKIKSDSFTDTIKRFREDTLKYDFLLICGELVSYIIGDSENKNDWNKYPDKRVIARSETSQFNWVVNLIKYKTNTRTYEGINPNIANAIKFLKDPEHNLSMISNAHRAKLLNNIFSTQYESDEGLEVVFSLFKLLRIEANNPINNGVLFSRMLYVDEIKTLWLMGTGVEEPEEITPGGGPSWKNENRKIESTFLTDYYAENDLLNYELYASAIVSFINHKNTKPPLTIGIMAPWGKGKTSLMRFIEKKLKTIYISANNKDSKRTETENIDSYDIEADLSATFGLFIKWLKSAKNSFEYGKTLAYPTVWFNAWKFQKTEQIWAGFAHEIITQLVAQLPDNLAREEFWLRLNLKRIDQEKLKNTLRFKILNKLAGYLLTTLVGLVVIVIYFLSKPPLIILPLGGLISALSLWSLISKIKLINKEKIDFDITKFIRQPGYSEKRGYFQEVEEDLRDVMNILIANEYPAVIFIDDLDRCSPNTVAEVVEAINLFISGDFPKCYFILGQDAQMVAASLDVAYDKIGLKSTHLYREQGSLGWHFMEKFVQLQFCIPVISDEILKGFFRNFFKRENKVDGDIDYNKIISDAKALEERIDNSTNINDVLTTETNALEENLKIIDPVGAVRLQEKIIIKAAEQYDDNDPEVQELIEKLYNFIGPSPRSIKRFINLYRFYKFLQFTNRNVKLQNTTSIHLGQWIVCMIRWPQLVRAIQWNTESEFVKGATVLERAEGFETIFHKHDSFTKWAALVEKEAPGLDWLVDAQLYVFLGACKKHNNTLAEAVNMGVW